jgi:hypothetical protein
MLLQKVNHVIPAMGLFFAGQQAIREGHTGFGFYLGIFEIISSAALVVLFVREARAAFGAPVHRKHPAHPEYHGVDWVDIAAGFVLVAEALEHWHLKHHVARPVILSAITTFWLGLFHGRIAARKGKRRVLRVTEDGVSIPGRLFKARKLQATWSQLASIDVGERWAVIATRAGRVRKLDLQDLEHPAEIRAALREAQARIAGHAGTAELVPHTAE